MNKDDPMRAAATFTAHAPTVTTGSGKTVGHIEHTPDEILRTLELLRAIRNKFPLFVGLTVAVGPTAVLIDAKWGNQGRTLAFNLEGNLTETLAMDKLTQFIVDVNNEIDDDLK